MIASPADVYAGRKIFSLYPYSGECVPFIGYNFVRRVIFNRNLIHRA